MANTTNLLLVAEAFRLIDEVKASLPGADRSFIRLQEIMRTLGSRSRAESQQTNPTLVATSPTQTLITSPTNEDFSTTGSTTTTPKLTQESPTVQQEKTLAALQDLTNDIRKYNRKLILGSSSILGTIPGVLTIGVLASVMFLTPVAGFLAAGITIWSIKRRRKRTKNRRDTLYRESNDLLIQAAEAQEQIDDPAYVRAREELRQANKYYDAAIGNQDALHANRLRKSNLDRPKPGVFKKILNAVRGQPNHIRLP